MKSQSIQFVVLAVIGLSAAACSREEAPTSAVQSAPAATVADTVCKGAEEMTNSDPHAKQTAIKLTIGADDRAELKTYSYEAHEAYIDLDNALTDDNLQTKETFEVRYEHDNFGLYLHDLTEGYLVASVLGDGLERGFVRDYSADERLSVDLKCNR